MIATMINNALGGKAEISDFMLNSPTEEKVATIHDVMKLLAGK